jgi:hypothetical protein
MRILRWKITKWGVLRFFIELVAFVLLSNFLFGDSAGEAASYAFKCVILAILVGWSSEFIICFCKTAYDEIRRRKEGKG